MIITLVRHGQSKGNTKEVNATEIGDCNVPLSGLGIEQAKATGKAIGADYLANALIYFSPYLRTRQTKDGILDGSNVIMHDAIQGDIEKITQHEELRLREVEFGFNKTLDAVASEREMRKVHGWMYYRYMGGESPADVFDRMCHFIDSMYREIDRRNANRVLIVTHGMTLRCFVARFLHLTVEQFTTLRNPSNCAIITIANKNLIKEPNFIRGKWAVTGLEIRKREDD